MIVGRPSSASSASSRISDENQGGSSLSSFRTSLSWHFFCLIDDYNHDLCSAYAHHQGFGRQEGPSVASLAFSRPNSWFMRRRRDFVLKRPPDARAAGSRSHIARMKLALRCRQLPRAVASSPASLYPSDTRYARLTHRLHSPTHPSRPPP